MKLIIVTGQTATGKTSYALKLAQEQDGELINCDSRQIYKHLDIITGKDLEDHTFHKQDSLGQFDIGYYTLGSSRIWLYDIVDPKQYFSSFDYVQCAVKVIKDILNRGKTPILVGGTYFYIQHLLYDVLTENIPPNWELRSSLEGKSIEELQTILKDKNSTLFERLNNSERNNPQRLIRKIEIASVGEPHKGLPKMRFPDLPTELTGFKYQSKDSLKVAIAKRVEARLKQGALEEVRNLLKKGYSTTDPGLQTIGYKQLIPLAQNSALTSVPQIYIDEWITKEVQYAKRQLTFMKKNTQIQWKEI